MLAFHKVNGNKWTENASSHDFKKLAEGRGGFKLKYPGHGKHVEADLSRQVLVLARHGKAQEIYHISSGAPATPTITGHFNFYRKEPGTNSHGMVNSVYFIRGYATHGYPRRPGLPGQPRLPAQSDPRLAPHLQLDRHRGPDRRLPLAAASMSLEQARATLAAELREHALVIGEVTLTSGKTASYYVDAKRAILRQPAFGALGDLVAAKATELGAAAVGGMTMGADPIASAALAGAGGEELLAFFVRKEKKEHGLQRWVEGPLLEPGTRVLVVEDVVTTGGSTVKAIERCLEERLEIVGTVSVLDRLAGGGAAIADRRRRPLHAARDDRRHLPGPGGLRTPVAASSAACVRSTRRLVRPCARGPQSARFRPGACRAGCG